MRSYRLQRSLAISVALTTACLAGLFILRREVIGPAFPLYLSLLALPGTLFAWLLTYRIRMDGTRIFVETLFGKHEIDFTNRQNFQLAATKFDIGRPTARAITTRGKQITVWIQLLGARDGLDLLRALDFKTSSPKS